ncbi:MAG: LL-diaminopimelate aminotransferase [Verrucomicrobiota bacterium]|nr:LL-diaminopimelate aminotransferase [Verrucomicrobiota bacterium]
MEHEAVIRQCIAERLGGADFGLSKAIYKFEKIKRAKRAAQKENPGIELLDMGVGEPDDMADALVRDRLKLEVDQLENRGYTDNGIVEFKDAAAGYMSRVFGVEGIEPETDVLHCIGAKSALSMLPAVLINPGDVVLMTTPGYPVFATHAAWYGAEIINLPLLEENGFLPDLDAVSEETWKRTKAMVVNYPNNPTGAVAGRDFFERLIQLAKRHCFIVLHDAAYAALRFDGKPFSFLSVPGAKDVGLELHSLSKSYNMTGWRIGFVAGNPLLVNAFGSIKDNSDSGQFAAIQKAAMVGLQHPEITERITEKYSRRMDLLVDALNLAGFRARKPKGSFFLYVSSPKACRGGDLPLDSAEAASQFLIKEALVSTVPWDDAGAYLRFSVTFQARGGEVEERRVIGELGQRLAKLDLVF